MTPLVRGPQSFFSLFRPSRLLSRRMFCDSSSKPVLLPKACGTEKATKNKRTRDVVYIYILGKQTNKPSQKKKSERKRSIVSCVSN